MKKSMILVVLICVTAMGYTQILIPYYNTKRQDWGYCNTGKEIVISSQFQEAYPFIDGRAIVKYYGSYGIINQFGNFISEIKYEKIYPFSEGYAAVLYKGKIGFINIFCKEIIPCMYDYFERANYHFSEGRALIKSGAGYGYIDYSGTLIIDFQYSEAIDFHDGFALVKDKNRNYKLIDPDGKLIASLDGCSNYHHSAEGLISIKKDGKWGFVDKTGKTAIPFMFDWAGEFSEGLAVAQKGKKYIFIDRAGKTVLKPKGAVYLDNFHEGLARIEKKDRKNGFINKEGEIVIPCIYGRVYDFKDGYAVVEESGWNGKEWKVVHGVINTRGKPVCTFKDGLVNPSDRLPDALFYANNKDGATYVSMLWGDFSDTYEKNRIAAEDAAFKWPTAAEYPYYVVGDYREISLSKNGEFFIPNMEYFGNHFSVTDLGGGKVHLSYNFNEVETNRATGIKTEYSFYGKLDFLVSWGELPTKEVSFRIGESTEAKGFILTHPERIIPGPQDNTKKSEVKPANQNELEEKWESSVKNAWGTYKVRADELYIYVEMQDGSNVIIKAKKYKKRSK